MFKSLSVVVFTLVLVTCASAIYEFRLGGGSKPSQGRLETRRNNTWGSMCGLLWDYENSLVACRQLGYPGLVTFFHNANQRYGDSSGPVHMQGVTSCTGTESSINDCSFSASACSHSEDVVIICQDLGYIGCYHYARTGIIPNAVTYNYDFTNTDDCIVGCRGSNYQYAGLSGGRCSCTFREPSVELNLVDDLECTARCIGNKFQSCGGSREDSTMLYSFFSTDLGFCVDLEPPRNGSLQPQWFRYGQVVTFQCEANFQLVGSRSLQCLANPSNTSELLWNGTVPICRALSAIISTNSTPVIAVDPTIELHDPTKDTPIITSTAAPTPTEAESTTITAMQEFTSTIATTQAMMTMTMKTTITSVSSDGSKTEFLGHVLIIVAVVLLVLGFVFFSSCWIIQKRKLQRPKNEITNIRLATIRESGPNDTNVYDSPDQSDRTRAQTQGDQPDTGAESEALYHSYLTVSTDESAAGNRVGLTATSPMERLVTQTSEDTGSELSTHEYDYTAFHETTPRDSRPKERRDVTNEDVKRSSNIVQENEDRAVMLSRSAGGGMGDPNLEHNYYSIRGNNTRAPPNLPQHVPTFTPSSSEPLSPNSVAAYYTTPQPHRVIPVPPSVGYVNSNMTKQYVNDRVSLELDYQNANVSSPRGRKAAMQF